MEFRNPIAEVTLLGEERLSGGFSAGAMFGVCRSCLPWRLRGFILLLSMSIFACTGGKSPLVVVSGKTVYGKMAIEEVQVRAILATESGWIEQARVRSGYHGTFVVDLSPGRYRLEARGRIFSLGTEVPLSGTIEDLEVPAGAGRIDRVRIDLTRVPQPE